MRLRSVAVVAVATAIDLAAGSAGAQAAPSGALTEAEVIRIARERAPGSLVADATGLLADAQERTAGLLQNPSLAWERETVLTGQDGTQDVLRATFPVEIARPRSTRALVASQSAWMRADASQARTLAILEAVMAFYDAATLARRVEVLAQAVESLEEAARVLRSREEAGSTSGYESTRLAVATEVARSHLALARGELEGARARLGALLGVDARALTLDTSLALVELPSAEELARTAVTTRDLLEHARASARLAATADERAAFTRVPTVYLSGGANFVSGGGRRYGYLAGVSVTLPVFDHGQGLRAEAEAQRALAEARAEALTRAVQGEIASTHAAYAAARAELERFDRATGEAVDTLLRAASSGYREGERTVLELVDAQRARTEILERRVELLAAVKRAEARVRAAGGVL